MENLEITTYYNNKRNGKGNQESSRFGSGALKIGQAGGSTTLVHKH